MKILMATHYFESHKGGIELVAGELFRRLSNNNQEIIWIAGDSTPAPQPVGASHSITLPILNFVEKRIGVPLPVPTSDALRQIYSQVNSADVVLIHDCLYLSNIATFLAARASSIPVVIVQHIGVVPYKNPLLNILMKVANATLARFMLCSAQQVVFISEATKAFFGGVRFKNLPIVIYNGVDSELYRTPTKTETKSLLRNKHQLPPERPAILFVGRFVEKKGISILKHMVAERPDLTWVFAGWGPLDPSAWDAHNVRVFSHLYGASLASLYRACDVLVLPSTGEGFPLVLQEGLASGLPIVCGKETLAADPALVSFVCGVPVHAGDDIRNAKAFLYAIDKLLELQATGLDDVQEKRRAFAIQRYSWRNTVEQYIGIVSRVAREANSQESCAQIRGE